MNFAPVPKSGIILSNQPPYVFANIPIFLAQVFVIYAAINPVTFVHLKSNPNCSFTLSFSNDLVFNQKFHNYHHRFVIITIIFRSWSENIAPPYTCAQQSSNFVNGDSKKPTSMPTVQSFAYLLHYTQRRRVGRTGGYIDMFSYYPSSSDPTNCAAMYSLIPTTIHSFNWKNIWQIHTNQFHAATTPAIISANPPTHSKSTTDNVMKSVLLSSPRRVVVRRVCVAQNRQGQRDGNLSIHWDLRKMRCDWFACVLVSCVNT